MRTLRPALPAVDRALDASARDGQRGFALIGTILLLFLLAGLVASLSISGQTEVRVAQNYEAEAKARAAAEAGLNHSVSVVLDKLATWKADGFANEQAAVTALLVGPDGLTGTAAADADNGSLEALGADPAQRVPREPGLRTITADETYEARMYDEDDAARGLALAAADVTRIHENSLPLTDNNKRLVVRAVGHGPNDATVTLEAIVGFGMPDPAILVNGDLDLWGNVDIDGSDGSVHANGDADIWGSPSIEQDFTATGTMTSAGSPDIGGESGGGYPPIPVPDIHASNFFSQAEYVLTTAGTITNQAGTVTYCAGAACAAWGGWTFAGTTWSINNNTMHDGIYYVKGDVAIAGSPGTPASPVSVTLITEGSIDISGSIDATARLPGYFMVADGDVLLRGSLNQHPPEARLMVREQVSIGGNVALNGQIIVQNVPSVATLVAANSVSSFFGSFSMTYSGGLGTGVAPPIQLGFRKM